MKIWLTTDTHFGHEAMIEYCGRKEGFEEEILCNLEKFLHGGDLLIHLGDFCIGADEYWHEKFMSLPGKKFLVKGNHDHKSNSWYFAHGWDFVCDQFRDRYFGKNILFSHIPQPWDGWHDVNVHGHFHNSDHRRMEPELWEIRNGYQKLLAIEYTDMKPVKLEDFIKPTPTQKGE